MELYVQKSDLFSALDRIEGIIDIKRLMPVLTHCLFTVNEDNIQLFGTDLSLSVITSCNAEIIKPGTIIAPAKKLYELLRTFPEGNIHLKYEEINNRLKIILDNYRFSLSCIPVEDFPSVPEYKSPDSAEFCASFLSNIIKKIQFSISSLRSSIGLPGMLIDFKPKSIACATTDSHRLSVGEFYMPRYTEDFPYINQYKHLSKKTITEFIKLFSNDRDIRCYLTEKSIAFEQDDTILTAKFLELDYPDYKTLIPKDIYRVYQMNRADLHNAVRTAVPLSSELTNSVLLDFSGEKVTVKPSDSQIGSGEVILDVKPDKPHEDCTIEFNAFYLMDIIASLSEEYFELCTQENPKDSVILRDKEMSHFNFVIMPLS